MRHLGKGGLAASMRAGGLEAIITAVLDIISGAGACLPVFVSEQCLRASMC